MKLVQLTEEMVIAGVPHGPETPAFPMDDDAAIALRDAEQATITEADGLETHTVDQLHDIATAEDAPLHGVTRKADIIKAIRLHRAAPPSLDA